MPGHLSDLERCRLVHETVPGWEFDLTRPARPKPISPQEASPELEVGFLTKQTGVPVSIVFWSAPGCRGKRHWAPGAMPWAAWVEVGATAP